MASYNTKIADMISPEVLGDMSAAKFPDMLVLGNTNLVQVDGEFPLGSPGTEFKMPFFKRSASFALMTEGVPLETNKLTTGVEYATVKRAGVAYEVLDTAELVTVADPVAELSNQLAKRAAEYLDGELVVALEKTPNLSNITAVGSGTWDQNTAVNAMVTTLGDNFQLVQNGGRIILHSKVYGDLVKVGAIQNQYQFGANVMQSAMIPTLAGLPIMVSDRCGTIPGTPTNYKSYIVGPEALALFYQRQVMVEFDRDPLKQSNLIVGTVHYATHLFGWDDKTNAQAAEDAKSIHAIMITSK